MSEKPIETRQLTQAEFELFKGAVESWQEQLGLTDWRVTVKMEAFGEEDGGAEVSTNDRGRSATVRLHATQTPDVTPETLRAWACHEVLHVLLDRMDRAARSDVPMRGSDAAGIEHGIINRLVRVLCARKDGLP